jgi:hypothetical protein
MTAKEHNKLVGIFLMAHGGLQMVVMLIIGLVYGVIGSAILAGGRRGEEQIVGAVFIGVVAVVVFVSLIMMLPQVIGGYKIFKERPGARTWGIVGSILSCLSFPIGTAVGVYGMWFLFGDEGRRFYLGGGQQMFQPIPQQPPPNSWQ